jgi:choline-sulfatase
MRILYLDLDTLRPDHLGCYGYHRNTSPNIDRICRSGIRFDNYYCSDAPCLPSRAALMTGLFGYHSGVVGHGGTAADLRLEGVDRGFRSRLSRNSLPALLKSDEILTTFIGGFAERHSAWWFYAGFREIYDTGLGGMESAETVTPIVLDWIDRNAQRDNWYLHVNYWDPHTPYRAPLDFGNPFAKDPLPAWLTQELIDEHRKLPGPHSAQDIAMYDNRTDPLYPRQPGEVDNLDTLRQLIDGYDTGIRYMDNHIGRVFDALISKGVYDDVAIVISSDHGENLGELGVYAEHGTADSITCRVPLIMKWPGGQKGIIHSGFHYNLDLGVTFHELLSGVESTPLDGQSFASVIMTGEQKSRSYLVLSQCAHVCQRSVRWGPWLYMRTWHDGYHLFPDSMLFNLENDPHEQYDLAQNLPMICQQAENYLDEWMNKMKQSMPNGYVDDPLNTVLREGGPYHARGMLPTYIKRLEATGRSWAVPELKTRHPDEF